MMYIAFLIKWYVIICFFSIFFCSFHGKNPLYCVALLISIGMSTILNMSLIFFDIF